MVQLDLFDHSQNSRIINPYIPSSFSPHYEPRDSDSSVLRYIILEYLETFLEQATERDGGSGVPKFVDRAFQPRLEEGEISNPLLVRVAEERQARLIDSEITVEKADLGKLKDQARDLVANNNLEKDSTVVPDIVEAIENDEKTREILSHWQKLGTFRVEHPSIGAGLHKMLSKDPYIFKRTYSTENYKDVVIVGLDLPIGKKEIKVANTFENGALISDSYSGKDAVVENGKLIIETNFGIVLLEENK